MDDLNPVSLSMDNLLSAVIDSKPVTANSESDAFVRFRLPVSQAFTVGVIAERIGSPGDVVVSALVDAALSDLLSFLPDAVLAELEASLSDRFSLSTGLPFDVEFVR